MQLPQTVEVKGIRVLTTKQIAKEYGTNETAIRTNFSRNRTKFIEGKHYIALTGDELRKFKDDITQCNAVKGNDITQCNAVGTRTNLLYLWTEKGALLHAKSLNTEKAWQVYDYLVDFYFRAKANEPEIQEKKEPEKRVSKKIDISSETGILKAIQKIRRDITCMDVLLEKCENETWESKYIDTKFEAMDMVRMIAEDCNKLAQLQPKIIQEINW